MNILDFIKKHSSKNIKNKDWNKDWKSLLKESKKNGILRLCFHTLLEESYSFELLKEIIEYDEKGKKEILNDVNTFKFACAFGNNYLIIYLNDKVKEHNIAGAINATFMQYRVDNLHTLELLGYKKEIYTEANLCQAISRANQVGCSLNIVEYLFNNLENLSTISTYVKTQLENQDWIKKIITSNYETTFSTLLDLNSEKINKQIIIKSDELMSNVLLHGNTYFLDKIMNSHLKEDFIKEFNKNKKKIVMDNLSLDMDKNKVINYMIDHHKEILKHEYIKLWMINSRSLKINEFINEKREIGVLEIKKAFIISSSDTINFSKILKLYPKFNYQNFTIQEAVKILNNLYIEKKNDEIDYNYDSQYMNLSRKILIKNKKFGEYQEEIRTVIHDSKMYNLLCKENMKNILEAKYLPKLHIKRMKI